MKEVVEVKMDREFYELLREYCEFIGFDINEYIVNSIVFNMGAQLDSLLGTPVERRAEKIAKRFVELTKHPVPKIE